MARVYKYVIFRNKIGIPTIFGSRSPVIQKIFERKCATSIAERVPLRRQGTEQEQGSREIGGVSHGDRFYGSFHNFHGSKPNCYDGFTLPPIEGDKDFRGSCWKVPWNPLVFTSMGVFLLSWQ